MTQIQSAQGPATIKEQLKALESVQEIDLKMDLLKKNKGVLPASLKALDDQMAKLNLSVTSKNLASAEITKNIRQTQAAKELTQDRFSRSSARLESVKNTQEYQATLKEIDQLKKQQDSLTEQLKKLEADQNQIQTQVTEIQSNLAKLQSERESQASTLLGETGKLDQQLQELMQERLRFSPRVDKRLLSQYDRVRVARGGLGIAPAVGGQCKACNMMVPPQQFNELQKGSVMHSCPNCHRVLFVPAVTA